MSLLMINCIITASDSQTSVVIVIHYIFSHVIAITFYGSITLLSPWYYFQKCSNKSFSSNSGSTSILRMMKFKEKIDWKFLSFDLCVLFGDTTLIQSLISHMTLGVNHRRVQYGAKFWCDRIFKNLKYSSN